MKPLPKIFMLGADSLLFRALRLRQRVKRWRRNKEVYFVIRFKPKSNERL